MTIEWYDEVRWWSLKANSSLDPFLGFPSCQRYVDGCFSTLSRKIVDIHALQMSKSSTNWRIHWNGFTSFQQQKERFISLFSTRSKRPKTSTMTTRITSMSHFEMGHGPWAVRKLQCGWWMKITHWSPHSLQLLTLPRHNRSRPRRKMGHPRHLGLFRQTIKLAVLLSSASKKHQN